MRRRLLILAAFLLAGAVVNVAVAWGCARWPRDIFSVGSQHSVALSFQDIAWWNKHVAPLFDCNAESAYERREVGIEARMMLSAATTQGYAVAIHVASGWPARSLSGEFWDRSAQGKAPQWSERQAVVVYMTRSFAIPTRPIWSGLTANTIFYAAILWLLICGPFALRRLIRMKRGQCQNCGYRIGESAVCSECGEAFYMPSRAAV